MVDTLNLNPSQSQREISISVVIPAYNVEAYIDRAIASVNNQEDPVDEIIVVDDGSTDKTLGRIGGYGDALRCFSQENKGPGAARNLGVQEARHDWIAFLDADDEWLPNRISRQRALLRKFPDLVWVGGNHVRCLCGQGRRENEVSDERLEGVLQKNDQFDHFLTAFYHKIHGWTGTMLIKREVLLEAGLFQEGPLRSEDTDLWLRIGYRYHVYGYVRVPIAIYHMNIADSLASRRPDEDFVRRFIQRHLSLAAEQGQTDNFLPCAVNMIRAWIRGAFFDQQVLSIRAFMRTFSYLLPWNYKCTVYALTVFPRLTMRSCLVISGIVRRLGLRRRAIRSVHQQAKKHHHE